MAEVRWDSEYESVLFSHPPADHILVAACQIFFPRAYTGGSCSEANQLRPSWLCCLSDRMVADAQGFEVFEMAHNLDHSYPFEVMHAQVHTLDLEAQM